MIKDFFRKISAVALSIVLIPISACSGEKVVICEHQIMQHINEKIAVGSQKSKVDSFLRTIGADFSIHEKEELVMTKDKDSSIFESKIIVIAKPVLDDGKLITSSELMTIGFDKDDLVKAVSCEKIYTGP